MFTSLLEVWSTASSLLRGSSICIAHRNYSSYFTIVIANFRFEKTGSISNWNFPA